jgi:hypothetical protein
MVLQMARPTKNAKTGVYYFRQKTPADLVAIVGKKEVGWSLGTKDPEQAKVLNTLAVQKQAMIWERHRKRPEPLPHAQIVALSGILYRDVMATFGQEPGEASIWEEVRKLLDRVASTPDGLAKWYGPDADRLLLEQGIVTNDASRARLLTELDRALRQAVQQQLQRAEGDYSPDPKEHRFPCAEAQVEWQHALPLLPVGQQAGQTVYIRVANDALATQILPDDALSPVHKNCTDLNKWGTSMKHLLLTCAFTVFAGSTNADVNPLRYCELIKIENSNAFYWSNDNCGAKHAAAKVKPFAVKASKGPANDAVEPDTIGQVDEQVDEQTDGQTDGQVDEQTDEQVDEQTDDQVDEQTDEQVDEQTDEQVDEQTDEQVDEQTDEQVDEQTDEQVDEQTDEQVDEQTDEQGDEQTDEQVDEQTDEQVDEQADEQVDEQTDEQVDEQVDEQTDEKDKDDKKDKDDNGHGNDEGKVDPSNPGKSKP